jgi:hypothetical protein
VADRTWQQPPQRDGPDDGALASQRGHEHPAVVVPEGMKLIRTVAAAGIAKKLYDESRKPHNRAKIQAAVDRVKARRKPRS